jgi:hypothetical protein
VTLPAGERGQGGGQLARHQGPWQRPAGIAAPDGVVERILARGRHRRITGQQELMKPLERWPGLGAQLISEPPTDPAVLGQRFRLTAAAKQRQHAPGRDPFVHRMPGAQLDQVRQHSVVASPAQLEVDEVEPCGLALLDQRGPYGADPGAAHAGERVAPPQRQRLGEQPGSTAVVGQPGQRHKLAEPVQVDACGIDRERVPGGSARDRHLGDAGEGTAQERHVGLDRVHRVGR